MKVFINEHIMASNEDVWIPDDKSEFEENIKNLLASLNCFQFFNESEVFYNSLGINRLIEALSFIDKEEQYFLFNEIDQLRQFIIDIEAKDWSQEKLHRDDHNYIVQLQGGHTHYISNGTTLAEAAEYSHTGHRTVLLNFISSQFNAYGIININRVNVNPPEETNLVKLNLICTEEDAIKYYLKNRESIQYNHNPKHGENHTEIKRENGEIVSPLECTQGEAGIFIQLAVAVEKGTRDLVAYDSVRKKFIRFKYENTTNPKTYHAFYPHDQNFSSSVKNFLIKNMKHFVID